MGYGSRNIDGSDSAPVVTIRGQGSVQRVSPFTELSHVSRVGADILHKGPFFRPMQLSEKREVITNDVNARYAEMRRKMHKVMAEKSEIGTGQPETVEPQDDSADDRSQLNFFDPIQSVRKRIIKKPSKRKIIEAAEAFARSLEENNSSGPVSVLVDDDPADNFGNTIPVDAITLDPDWDEVVQNYIDPLAPEDTFRF